MSFTKARRAGELADNIESAYTKRPSGTGTKIEIEDGDWPLMVEALRLCESLLTFEAEQEAKNPASTRTTK